MVLILFVSCAKSVISYDFEYLQMQFLELKLEACFRSKKMLANRNMKNFHDLGMTSLVPESLSEGPSCVSVRCICPHTHTTVG